MYLKLHKFSGILLFLLVGYHLVWSGDSKPIELQISEADSANAEYLIHAMSSHLLDSLTDSGYPFAKVSIVPKSILYHNGELEALVKFQIETGSFYRIGTIGFTGKEVTSERLLTLESRLERGDMFRRTEMVRAQERLGRLSFISHVDSARLYDVGNGILEIEIPIHEQKVNRASGIVSMAPGSDKPTGELTLEFGNLLGTGRQMGFSWHGLNPDRRGIRFNYREPWLFSQPLHPRYELERWEDTLTISTKHHVDIEWEPYDRFSLFAGVTKERITFPERDTVSSTALLVNLGASFNQMDHVWNPTSGYSVSYHSSNGVRHWNGSDVSSSSLRRERIDLIGATTISNIWVFYGRCSVEDISGSGIVTDDLTRIGGIGSIRGYPKETYLARGSLLGGGEVRWRPDRNGYLGLFGDIGYIYRYDSSYDYFDRLLSSFGVTASIMTEAGRLGLDIGWATDEPLDQTRLHVKLEGRF